MFLGQAAGRDKIYKENKMSDDIYSVYILKINFTLPLSYASFLFCRVLETRRRLGVNERSVGVIVNT